MKQNITTILIIFGIVFLLLIFLIIFPLFNKIKQESDNLIAQKRMLAEFNNRAENLKNFQATYQTYQANLEKIDQLFINPEEPINFIEFLEKEASDSQLSIKISSLSLKEVKGDFWSSMNFKLALVGSFSHFLEFLNKLETSFYLIDTLNLNLNRLTEKEGFPEGNVSATLLIKVYTQEQ